MALLTRTRFVSALIAGLGQVAAMSGAEAQAPLEPGRITDGRLAGLFYRVAVATVGPRRVDTRTWLFLPAQRVSRVYPFGGVFDPSRCSAASSAESSFERPSCAETVGAASAVNRRPDAISETMRRRLVMGTPAEP